MIKPPSGLPISFLRGPAILFLLLVALQASAAVRYVSVANPNPSPPFTNWPRAARAIQDAIDIAQPGDEIVVTNGVYRTGGRVVYGTLTNRVAVTKLLTLRSVNGPNVTVIQGYPVPGATNGDSAVRRVYLTNGAALLGFSLTVGATRSSGDFLTEQSGGGVWCESASAFASNCLVMGNSANNYGGGVYGGTLRNCTVNSNSAHFGGGGAYGATMRDCLLNANRADYGGGAYAATLEHCIISGNSAGGDGGGANFCTLNNCKLSGNSAYEGGGASSGTLNYCTLSANLAETGGGAFVGTLNNCAIIGNSATNSGGGAAGGAMNNCTLVGNSATSRSGGADGCVMNNCILYYNVAPQGAN